MEKNKKSRIFRRVLHRLSWANVFRARGEKYNARVGIYNAYKEVLAAKRSLEEIGCENVKVAFYAREWHIQFTHYNGVANMYYTVSSSGGYANDYHNANKSYVNDRISTAEFELDYTLRRDYSDYQMFWQYADNILFWILTRDEYDDYRVSGNINAIPYDVAIRLWRDLRERAWSVVDEAIAYKKAVL